MHPRRWRDLDGPTPTRTCVVYAHPLPKGAQEKLQARRSAEKLFARKGVKHGEKNTPSVVYHETRMC